MYMERGCHCLSHGSIITLAGRTDSSFHVRGVCVCGGGGGRHGSHVEIRGQLCDTCSLLPVFHGFGDWTQVPGLWGKPAEPSCLPTWRVSVEWHDGYIVDSDTCLPWGDGDKNWFGGGGRFSLCRPGDWPCLSLSNAGITGTSTMSNYENLLSGYTVRLSWQSEESLLPFWKSH